MIDAHLARRLVDAQFPQWADLPITRVALDGVDNCSALGVDAGTWSRGRGWALWKALISLAGQLEAGDDDAAAVSRRDIERVLADHAGQC